MSVNLDEDVDILVMDLQMYTIEINSLSSIHKKRLISGFETCIRGTLENLSGSYHNWLFNNKFREDSQACFSPVIKLIDDEKKSIFGFWQEFDMINKPRTNF